MYLAPAYTVQDQDVLVDLVQHNPLGILTTALASTLEDGFPLIQSSHIPFILDNHVDEARGNDQGLPSIAQSLSRNGLPQWAVPKSHMTLRGHLARNNPQAKALISVAKKTTQASGTSASGSQGACWLPDQVQVLFHGPAHGYVTPKWYVQSKGTTGKVVPTWNYSAVQIYGKIRLFHDSKSQEADDFLQQQIEDLTNHGEDLHNGADTENDDAWEVDDAPKSYIDAQKKAIVGFEIHVEHISGKFKMSQKQCEADAMGVAEGYKALGTPDGDHLSDLVIRCRRP